MSDDGYDDMETDREERGLSRSAYVEQAVRKSINRNTKIETVIEALTTTVAVSFFAMVFSALAMAWTYLSASAAMSGQFIGAFGLFAASTLLTLILPFVVEQLEEYETARMAKQVEA
jgi:uncharacterized YccA/Bax inhibitor family protein